VLRIDGGLAPTVALYTVGCKVNQAETEALSRDLAAAGFDLVPFDAPADVYVVNTCTVTHVADRKSRQMLSQARRRNPTALTVATGCYATTDAERLRGRGDADLVLGNDAKPQLVRLVMERLRSAGLHAELRPPAPLSGAHPPARPRTRAFLRVQDGCDSFCGYCIVPYARGAPRSVPLGQVVTQVQSLVRDGYQEVVLTGVHLGLYAGGPGGSLGDGGGLALSPAGEPAEGPPRVDAPPAGLASLVQAILAQTRVPRLRLSSIEPQDLDPAFLSLWQDPRLCGHLHLPLQSGADSVLRRMGRRYTADGFADLVRRARAAIPGLAVTTDMIVGLPGETVAEADQSLDFARGTAFARIHVFKYSPRKGTPAASMEGQVPEAVKRQRSRALQAVSAESSRAFRAAFVGRVMDVLWEERTPGAVPAMWAGLTGNYIRVQAAGPDDLANRITPARLESLTGDGMRGTLAPASSLS
jgi:threonylcarbamoyladenosine tRNA methylthiotransferase MtaB